MSKSIRTVRFDQKELTKIDEFLKRNTFLDFSSLARMAINQFIEKPTIQIQPVRKNRTQSPRAEA